MTRRIPWGVAVALACVASAACRAQTQEPPMDVPAELAALAHVTPEQARATALAAFESAHVLSSELEEEGGHLIYSFDLRLEGRTGVEEVHVDALTGEVLTRKHETDAEEASER